MPAAKPASRAPRIPAWTLRVAASVVVVAAGTLIVVDRYGSSPRASTLEQLKAKDVEAPAIGARQRAGTRDRFAYRVLGGAGSGGAERGPARDERTRRPAR